MKITKVRGTQDKLDLSLHNFLTDKIKAQMALYNYSQIETPIIEPQALICRSLGQETDVVTKEMFNVVASGDEKICLRPEATASTMRAYLESGISEKPWRVFSYGPMFRHERPQKGRWRQFDQFNIELINGSSIAHDAEFLLMLDQLFTEKLLVEDYVLSINFLGTLEERNNYKIKLVEFLNQNSTGNEENSICQTCTERKTKNPLRALDCKSPVCQKIYESAPLLVDSLENKSSKEWEQIKDYLNILSVNFIENPRLVRGLDYYEGLVFEFSSENLGAQSAFCGGGRYELATAIGARERVPSLGAAIGLGRLLMLLEQNIKNLPIPQKPTLSVIIPVEEKQHGVALILAENLRENKKTVQVIFDNQKLQKMMKKANNIGAKFVLIIGEDEQASGNVTLKNMVTGDEQKISQSEAHTLIN
jgi:histidyl-tRNA synthetase